MMQDWSSAGNSARHSCKQKEEGSYILEWYDEGGSGLSVQAGFSLREDAVDTVQPACYTPK